MEFLNSPIELWAGIGLFLLGLAIGVLLSRSTTKNSSKTKRLEQKLSETQDAYTRYQAEVSAHFLDTARKVQNLNNSYREVHEQLATGASRLCSDAEASDFLAISAKQPKTGHVFDETHADQLPPMDYAPKAAPDEQGTLSESYGLKEESYGLKEENFGQDETGGENAKKHEEGKEPPLS